MIETLFLRMGWPRIPALLVLLVAALYALVVANSGAARPDDSVSRVGRAAPGLTAPVRGPDACSPGWSVISSPNVATYRNRLNGVAAVSAGSVWAVGSYNELGAQPSTLVEHWDGSAWSIVPSPNMGTDGSQLNGLAVVSAGDIWAVGQFSNGTVSRTLVEHWDGSSWSVITSPNVGSISNALNGIAAVSASNVWAVGYGGGGTGGDQTLVEHWDGSVWTIVPSPNGHPLANALNGVGVVSDTDVWAIGSTYDSNIGANRTLAEHWDGSAWTIVPTPDIGNNEDFLYAVTAISANDVWAVGLSLPDNFVNQITVAEHWDGSSWSIVPSPNVAGAGNGLDGVAGGGPGDVWATGYFSQNDQYFTLSEHWDGNSWAIVPSPNAGTSYNYLSGMAAVAGDIWAVGMYDDPGNDLKTLTEQFSQCAGSPTPAATTSATSTPSHTSTPVVTATRTSTPQSTSISGSPTPAATIPATRSATSTPLSTSTSMPTHTPGPVVTATPSNTPQSTPTLCTIHFSDVQPSDYFYDAVNYLACNGAISGYSDGTFRPYRNTTRGQVTKIVVGGFGMPIDTTGGPHFSDVPQANPFYPYVETAYHNGLVSGYGDNTFRPNNNVTRGQLSKIVVTAAVEVNGWVLTNPPDPTFTDVPFGSTFYRFIETAASEGVISGYSDHTFRPGNNATRGQIAKIAYLAIIATAGR